MAGGTFFGFNTALKSLFAQQKAINTTSHNIANASTPGYTRQQAVMAADFAFPVPSLNRPGGAGQVGTGVLVVEMRRIRDQFLDKQIRLELSTLGQWEQRAETLKLVETVFIEPSDSGLSKLFNEFWVAWQELSKNAENVAIRTSLVETAVSLAEALNHAHSQLTTIVDDLKYIAQIKADQINTIAVQIDDLNKQIATIQLAGDAPNDLKDKRDLLLDELAKLVDFEIEETLVERPGKDGKMVKVPDGQIRIYIGTDPVGSRNKEDYLVHVNGKFGEESVDNVREIEFVAEDGEEPTFEWLNEDIEVKVVNGQLAGILESIDQVNEYIENLNDLAKNLAEKINELHVQGYDLNDQPGGDFFDYDPDNAAASITVMQAIVDDINKIAASLPGIDEGDHNGQIALRISQLRPGIDRQYDQLVSRIGVKTNESKRRVDGQEVLIGQLNERKESISGVNLDEEMAMMLQFQRIYQASATMITTLDEMIQTILSMKR
ncbi:MAG TPA: flagellar hook-associated protein FlgK [Clostridia bacterium]|nr:flagellar hook-associated protein FlgK [Clostridia bacterium]